MGRILVDGEFLPGFDHKVTAQGQIERKDLNGQNSSTAGGHARWKAWMLQVRLNIKMEDADDLLALRAMFQADGLTEGTTTTVDETGTEQTTVTSTDTGVPKVWEITDDTAAALGIFKVQFTEIFKVEQDDTVHVSGGGGYDFLTGELNGATGAPGAELSFCADVAWVGVQGSLEKVVEVLGITG